MFCPDKQNFKKPDSINYTNMTLRSLTLAIWVCYGCSGFWRDQTSALKQTLYGRMYLCSRGLGGLLGGLAPQGVCSWEGLLFREHPEPPHPGRVYCIHGQRELGKPQGRQFVADEVNIAKWVEKSLGYCQYGKSRNWKPQLRKMFTFKQCSRLIFI